MSIIIKSDQLNTLIYKYLQQCNLSHSAYTFFNQANLEQALTQYKFDVKSGQLVSLIERALIFSQIESHITMSDYEQCKEPFYLLKSHVCRITQRVREEKEKLLEQFNQNVFSAMRRVNSIHNNLQHNPQFEQIIYQQRAANFLDRVPLMIGNSQGLVLKMSKGETYEKFLSAYQPETQTITLMSKKDNFLSIIGILACKTKIMEFQIVNDLVVQILDNNQCQIFRISASKIQESILCFKLPMLTECCKIKTNRRIKHLMCFQGQNQFVVVNVNTKRLIIRGLGQFQWVDGYNYIIFDRDNQKLKKYSLKNDQKSSIIEFSCKLKQNIKIKISFSEIFFLVQSINEKKVLVYNFEQPQPIYIFDFDEGQSQEAEEVEIEQKLVQTMWVTANNTDKLIIITDVSIKTFDVQLNNFSKIIQISDYDIEVKIAGQLKKNQEQMYLVGLGTQNIIFYDVTLGKIQRVQIEDLSKKLFILNEFHYIAVGTFEKIYILQSSDVQSLFA